MSKATIYGQWLGQMMIIFLCCSLFMLMLMIYVHPWFSNAFGRQVDGESVSDSWIHLRCGVSPVIVGCGAAAHGC